MPGPTTKPAHPAIRFYVRSVAAGFGLAAVFTALLLWQDVAGLRHLVTHVQGGWLALFLLWFFNGIVLSGAQASVSLLLQAEREDDTPQGGRRAPAGTQPIRVKI
ncbi:hypothetical protein [Jannaschia aquimarina]|uniref:Uncharacterized protein n=1 Tax=Jannaschia aquimarina TaxID=935700 RepID=A0A0D1CJ11_9RHOB|nr:hypothetical protein [Jannaschia aquimarina]KIT14702.1 hypothetical protein jaqu_36440 [Jannaschia aquimarina]SNT38352.1 hypothetical protein SAMN05421775_113132 [Jannaschia aquimarina]